MCTCLAYIAFDKVTNGQTDIKHKMDSQMIQSNKKKFMIIPNINTTNKINIVNFTVRMAITLGMG